MDSLKKDRLFAKNTILKFVDPMGVKIHNVIHSYKQKRRMYDLHTICEAWENTKQRELKVLESNLEMYLAQKFDEWKCSEPCMYREFEKMNGAYCPKCGSVGPF